MNITTQWNITHMNAHPSLDGMENVISHVVWTCTATDADSGETVKEQAQLSMGLPSTTQFTAFSSLTEAEVLTWVKQILGESVVAQVENNVKTALVTKLAPIVMIEDLPWAKK